MLSLIEQRIVRALSRLLTTRSFQSLTIIDICKEASISRTSFYKLFTSKEDIFPTLTEIIFSKLSMILVEDLTFQEEVLNKAFEDIKSNYQTWQLLIEHGNLDSLFKTFIRDTVMFSDIDLTTQLARHYNVSEKFSSDIYISTIHSVLLTWIKGGCQESPEEITRIIKDSTF